MKTILVLEDNVKYTSRERVVETCRAQEPEAAARQLVELARYRSGALPDDVTVILTPL